MEYDRPSLNSFFFFFLRKFFASCYNTGVVIIKPVTGRASICLASLKTTRRLTAFGFIQKKKFVNIHIPSSGSRNTHNTLQYIVLCNISICRSKCIELNCTTFYAILIYCDSSRIYVTCSNVMNDTH